MTYYTVNAKVRAMRTKLLTVNDYEHIRQSGRIMPNIPGVRHEAERILNYVYVKSHRIFLQNMAYGLGGIINIKHYENLWYGLNFLDKPGRDSMKRVIGTEIDLQNILWMYRLKRFYKIYGQSTFGHLIPVGYKLSEGMLTKMAMVTDEDALLAEGYNSPYSGIFQNFSRGEFKLITAVRNKYLSEIRKNPNSILPTCAYLYEKYIEAKNITAMLESFWKGGKTSWLLL